MILNEDFGYSLHADFTRYFDNADTGFLRCNLCGVCAVHFGLLRIDRRRCDRSAERKARTSRQGKAHSKPADAFSSSRRPYAVANSAKERVKPLKLATVFVADLHPATREATPIKCRLIYVL